MPFFDSTVNFQNQIHDLFLFLWPSQVALWNLRNEIGGLPQSVESVTNDELMRRFARGSGIRGANLKRACISVSWEDQKSNFAKIMLVNIIALYEGWVSGVFEELKRHDTDQNATRREHKYNRKGQAKLQGVEAFEQIDLVRQPASDSLHRSIYPVINPKDRFDINIFLNRMKCFRCFKEIRNCLVHGGGLATANCQGAYNNYASIANPSSLNLKKEPICMQVISGAPVSLSIYGVVGFSDLVTKIALSIDAELSFGKPCESILEEKFRNNNVQRRTLNRERSRRDFQIKKIVRKAGLPTPVQVHEIENLLIQRGLVNI